MKFADELGRLKSKALHLAPLLLALALGISAAVLGWYYLRSSEREIAANLEREADSLRRDVVVPVRALRAGQPMTADLVAKRSVPREYVHEDALSPQSFSQFVGRQLTVDIAPGKPLLATFFNAPRKVFAEELEPGVRAVTIPVDEISSISGMLRAGDRIDFLYVVASKSVLGDDDSVVVPLLQDVEVRATGQITAEQFAEMRKRPDVVSENEIYRRQQYTTVTVGLQPQQAQTLVLAQRTGKIVAALRNPQDRQTMRTGIDATDLQSLVNSYRPYRQVPRPPVSPAPPPTRPSIEYIIGGAGGSGQVPAPLADALRSATAATQGLDLAARPMH